jgi:hypothetical protein
MSCELQSVPVEQLDIPHVSVRDIDSRIEDLVQKLGEISGLHKATADLLQALRAGQLLR